MKYRDVKTFILGVVRGIYVALTTLGYLITYCKIGSWLGVFIEACIFPHMALPYVLLLVAHFLEGIA